MSCRDEPVPVMEYAEVLLIVETLKTMRSLHV